MRMVAPSSVSYTVYKYNTENCHWSIATAVKVILLQQGPCTGLLGPYTISQVNGERRFRKYQIFLTLLTLH